MNQRILSSFSNELTKVAIDPVTAAGMVAGGKIMASNLLSRHAASIRPLRWIGKEVAGVGARTAMQGKPMLSRPFREAASAVVDPKLVGLYENAHAAGSLGAKNLQRAKDAARKVKEHLGDKGSPAVRRSVEFLDDVPLESKGVRKIVDYGFTPVSQVGRDIKELTGKAGRRVREVFRRRRETAAAT